MKKQLWITIVVLLVAAILFFLYRSFQEPGVSMAKAGERLAKQYNGTVTKSAEKNGHFMYTMKAASGEYVMTVDRDTGDLLDMKRVKEYKAPAEKPAEPGKEKTGLLTAEQAGKTALAVVPGTIDEIESGEDKGSFIVDIEAENGEEATVQVNAISGEVMSISWDD
ncbi:PepSY domain-containing protein [Domibacillus epiphyticus]|uniref:PepSY domain-containing protein n=1 Tax=Domibacillus epiphyticus TaxID=1714355 RepID=A0A1V2A7B3_9BACI|nr:PepSY domain-containing protein [Domibacillus epiphyticus]OMP66752.1 hypothetical protein BTO28_10650 [Domibacillus epiphyticus]